MRRLIPLLSVFVLLSANLLAQPRSSSETAKATPTIAEKVASMQKFPGYFPFYWDAKAGKLWLEIDKWNAEFLYVESLPGGGPGNHSGHQHGGAAESLVPMLIPPARAQHP